MTQGGAGYRGALVNEQVQEEHYERSRNVIVIRIVLLATSNFSFALLYIIT